jgi:hypothetical protein
MRFLANENFPGAAVAALSAAGHDVVWVRMAAPGMADPDVPAWAVREDRILLTFDKDFGELARGSALPRTCGVVLLRMPMPRPGDVGQRLADLITARDDWAGASPSSSPAASGCGRSDRQCRAGQRRRTGAHQRLLVGGHGAVWSSIEKVGATVDEDGHYRFAVAL